MSKTSKTLTISINEEYVKKLDIIAENEYSDRSKLIRKWIDENLKKEYEKKELL